MTVLDRVATTLYRVAVTLTCCLLGIFVYDVWMGLPSARLPQLRLDEWERLFWGSEALIALVGLRWTIRGERGFRKDEP